MKEHHKGEIPIISKYGMNQSVLVMVTGFQHHIYILDQNN